MLQLNLFCLHCAEEILPFELMPERIGQKQQFHRECLIRIVAGSLAHLEQRCSCFGGTDEDDSSLSIRENAQAVARCFADRQNADDILSAEIIT